MKKDKGISVKKIKIKSDKRNIPALVLLPKNGAKNAPGILWIHGGGYFLGMKEMVHMSRAVDLVKRFGAVVISPGYRLALTSPYPAALDDCYAALLYMKEHADELGVRSNQIMVGGESAGGGLCVAVGNRKFLRTPHPRGRLTIPIFRPHIRLLVTANLFTAKL